MSYRRCQDIQNEIVKRVHELSGKTGDVTFRKKKTKKTLTASQYLISSHVYYLWRFVYLFMCALYSSVWFHFLYNFFRGFFHRVKVADTKIPFTLLPHGLVMYYYICSICAVVLMLHNKFSKPLLRVPERSAASFTGQLKKCQGCTYIRTLQGHLWRYIQLASTYYIYYVFLIL